MAQSSLFESVVPQPASLGFDMKFNVGPANERAQADQNAVQIFW